MKEFASNKTNKRINLGEHGMNSLFLQGFSQGFLSKQSHLKQGLNLCDFVSSR